MGHETGVTRYKGPGCRDDILQHLHKIPYGGRIYEHILTTGYGDDEILRPDTGEFLFVRGSNWLDNPTSIALGPWNEERHFYASRPQHERLRPDPGAA